jgi:hypothetical protein
MNFPPNLAPALALNANSAPVESTSGPERSVHGHALLEAPVTPGETSNSVSYRIGMLVVVAVALLPILTVHNIPLMDWPNHLARGYILSHYESVPQFSSTYQIEYEPIPNIGMDVLMVFLQAAGLSVTSSGRAILVVAVVMFAVGCHLTGLAISGRRRWLAVLAPLIVYNGSFLYGFINYVLGVAFFLVTFSCALFWEQRWTAWRYTSIFLLTTTCYFVHLTSFGFVAVSFCIVGALRYIKSRALLRSIALPVACIPGFALYLLYMSRSGRVGTIHFNTLSGKASVAFGVLARTFGNPIKDFFVLGILLCLIVGVLAMARRVHVYWETMSIAVCLFLLFVISPNDMMTVANTDERFLLPAVILLAFSISIELPPHIEQIATIIAMLVCISRIAIIWHSWQDTSRQIEGVTALLSAVPAGATLYPAIFESDTPESKAKRLMVRHIASYATFQRDAIVANTFANAGQQPIVFRNGYKFAPLDKDGASAAWAQLRSAQFVLSYGLSQRAQATLERCGALLGSKEGIGLWQMNPIKDCSLPQSSLTFASTSP